MTIYTDGINKEQVTAIETAFDVDVSVHIPAVTDGISGELTHIQGLRSNNPGFVATVKHIGADGDYVAVHWHLSSTPSDEFKGKASVDLYKLSGNKIISHWHITQNLGANTASGNSHFSDLYTYAGTKPLATQESEAANKQLVTASYLGLFNDKKLSLLDEHFSPSYIQHNPYLPNGTQALGDYVRSGATGGLSFFATISDDDLVWTFSGNDFLSVVDIFRVDNKKIVEHYDVF